MLQLTTSQSVRHMAIVDVEGSSRSSQSSSQSSRHTSSNRNHYRPGTDKPIADALKLAEHCNEVGKTQQEALQLREAV